jgi:hypothetical protein
MPTVACVAMAAALLQLAAGAGKLWHPSGFVVATGRAGWAMPPSLVRAVAALEAAVAAWALAAGGTAAWALVAASYVAFTGFALVVHLTSGGSASCGCFGREETPVTRTHLSLTAAAALITGVAAAESVGGMSAVAVLPALVVAVLGYSVMVVLPPVRAAARTVRGV